ncbi:transaldolase family protein [Methylocaldum sp.]|uniref:transaldolase family protein n=1 Tax=Methylocaldum sp. TaxID=1969727 RepID=UPI002D674DC2|nr:transaldolase family protein [Methylocaldum sp.]HYE34478.1 transaldolase family protein [Methylocaldum sp.]
MSLFLDSALAADARQAMTLGFVAGITTNPTLMAKADRKPEDVIAELADICPGPVFYQLTAPTVAEREVEARRFLALRPNIALKIAMTTENLVLAAKFAKEGINVGMTASYSAAQTYLTCEAGVTYSIAYVNRSTRLQGDGVGLVSEMRAVVDACDTPTTILVASLKSASEVVQAVIAGAHHVTIPLPLLLEMGDHPLSDQAIEEFGRAVRNG